VVDSLDELRRVFEVKPDAKHTCASRPPTSAATGRCPASSAPARRTRARSSPPLPSSAADLAGITFHVGSQCRNPENWRVALEKARAFFDLMLKAGLKPRLLNIGGGYPVPARPAHSPRSR
jgi:ornithine decarboxylase